MQKDRERGKEYAVALATLDTFGHWKTSPATAGLQREERRKKKKKVDRNKSRRRFTTAGARAVKSSTTTAVVNGATMPGDGGNNTSQYDQSLPIEQQQLFSFELELSIDPSESC